MRNYENQDTTKLYCFTADQQIPWLGAGVGIIFGVIVVIADYVFTNKPTLTVLIHRIIYLEIIVKKVTTYKFEYSCSQ